MIEVHVVAGTTLRPQATRLGWILESPEDLLELPLMPVTHVVHERNLPEERAVDVEGSQLVDLPVIVQRQDDATEALGIVRMRLVMRGNQLLGSERERREDVDIVLRVHVHPTHIYLLPRLKRGRHRMQNKIHGESPDLPHSLIANVRDQRDADRIRTGHRQSVAASSVRDADLAIRPDLKERKHGQSLLAVLQVHKRRGPEVSGEMHPQLLTPELDTETDQTGQELVIQPLASKQVHLLIRLRVFHAGDLDRLQGVVGDKTLLQPATLALSKQHAGEGPILDTTYPGSGTVGDSRNIRSPVLVHGDTGRSGRHDMLDYRDKEI